MPAKHGLLKRIWVAIWERATVDRLLRLGLPIVGLLMLLTASNLGGQVVLWENAQLTMAGLLATAVVTSAAYRSTGLERRLRGLVAIGTAAWALGQVGWDVQAGANYFSIPAPSDVGFLFLFVPVSLALVLSIRGRVPFAEEVAAYLDANAIFLAITAVILAAYGDWLAGYDGVGAAVIIAYPIIHLATAGAGIVAVLTTRAALRFSGPYLLLGGFAVLGFAWVEWLRQAVEALPPAGSLVNYAFSIGIIGVGIGGATWSPARGGEVGSRRLATVVHGGLPLIALLGSACLLVVRHMATPQLGAVDLAALGVILLAGLRQTLLVHERGRLLDDSGHARGELEVALIQRAEADSRYRVLVEHMPAAVYIDVNDPEVSDGGKLAYMSPQIEAITGFPPEAFLADQELWPRSIHPDDREAALAAYAEHWATEGPLRADYRVIARDGSVIWVHDEAYAMTEVGGRRVSQGLLVDTTVQKRMEARLLHDALHDPLTGLANRVLFSDHVERAMASRRRGLTKVALLFLDLDDFKVVNDSLGHRAGDRLLVEVAHRLSGVIRAGDIAARQGGDEFTVLLDHVDDLADAVASAERLAAELRRPIELEGRSLVIGVSVGIALAGDEMGADDLLAHADAAMYAAKARGKARHAVFDPSMRVRARSRLEMEAELRAAIASEAFVLHYQPIVELATGGIVGLEALVRWRHPDRGMVPPNDFIPLAEESGLIVPLGRLIMAAACCRLRSLIDGAPGLEKLTMSVNVSPRQAVEPGFAAEVAEILRVTGVDASSIVLEITESLMLHESEVSDGSLRTLRDMGV